MTSLFLIDGDSVISEKCPEQESSPQPCDLFVRMRNHLATRDWWKPVGKIYISSHAVILLFQILQPPLLVLHVCKCCLLRLGKHLSRTQ